MPDRLTEIELSRLVEQGDASALAGEVRALLIELRGLEQATASYQQQVQRLAAELATAREAFDDLGCDLRRVTRERGDARLLCDVLRCRMHELREALEGVGVVLVPCACGVRGCIRCDALAQRREALGLAEDVPSPDGHPTAAGE